MSKNKKISPLKTPIRKKDILGRDLHVGDIVVCIPNGNTTNASGIGMICGETQCYTRVFTVGSNIIVGSSPIDTQQISSDRWNRALVNMQLHEAGFYLLYEYETAPWATTLRKYIQENS